jgi:hypothetical protein
VPVADRPGRDVSPRQPPRFEEKASFSLVSGVQSQVQRDDRDAGRRLIEREGLVLPAQALHRRLRTCDCLSLWIILTSLLMVGPKIHPGFWRYTALDRVTEPAEW